MSRPRRWWPATAFAISLLLFGCSGDDEVSTAAPEAAGSEESTATAADAEESDATATPEVEEADATATPVAEQPTTPDSAAEAPDDEAPAEEPEPVMNEAAYSDEGIHRILEDSCATCHSPGGPGSIEMTLAEASDAEVYADTIGFVTQERVMPPWPASDLSVPFLDDHSLEPEDIAAIERWVDAGGTIDVDPTTPIVASKPVARIEEPDLVLTSAKGAYAGSTAVTDDYRCLIYDPQVAGTEWILASHFEPDQVEVVHHGIIRLASAELRDQAEALDAAEPGPGWTCYSAEGLRPSGEGYVFRMAGWAPGAQPARQPDGYAIPLRPGDFFVVQVHYHYDNEAPADLSRFVLDLASDEDLAAVGGSYKALRGALYLGPAEIPCYEGDTEPLCDRELAIQQVADRYGRVSAALPDYFLAQCGSRVSDYEDMTDGTAWSSCDLPVQNPGRIVSLTGHMHELGQSIRLTLNPDTPDERILLDIPDWNFEWQFGYQPVDDIVIQSDDTIRIDCVWNRERAPYEAVGYIVWADGTGDEMCFSSITTAPV